MLKQRTTNEYVSIYGSFLGFVLGILISAVFLDSALWGLFTGPLGAIGGAYLAVYLLMADSARKRALHYLVPISGGVVGYMLGFCIPAATIFMTLMRQTGENALIAVMYAPCAGFIIGPVGAVSGILVARYLLKHWIKEEC
jgi:hypothetical protein